MRWRIAQFFEALWWKFYLSGKSPSSYLTWKRNYWIAFYNQVNFFLPANFELVNKKIIDAGCGPAGIFIWLNDFSEVFAFDPLLPVYSKMPHFSTQNYNSVTFSHQSIENFVLPNKYELIFCLNAINHVKLLDKAIENLTAHLQENALMIISVDVHHQSIFHYILSRLPFDILHPHQYFLKDYLKKLERHSCKILGTATLKKGFIFNYELIVAQKINAKDSI